MALDVDLPIHGVPGDVQSGCSRFSTARKSGGPYRPGLHPHEILHQDERKGNVLRRK